MKIPVLMLMFALEAVLYEVFAPEAVFTLEYIFLIYTVALILLPVKWTVLWVL